jgi:prolyl-tRNA editing enzyme YbaK/EbsC (Cys-tRNA(Pro) deacylase)
LKIEDLELSLSENQITYELITHDKPILSVEDAKEYFDVAKAAPVFILDTDNGLIAYIMSASRKRVDFSAIKRILSTKKATMATPEEIRKRTGCEVGAVPLVGLSLPCVFDKLLFDNDYVFGGSGDIQRTLKISPESIVKMNNVIAIIE